MRNKLLEVLEMAWAGGFTTKSDFSRSHADAIAMASCRKLITTRTQDGDYGRRWLITPKGCSVLFSSKEL